MSVSTIVQERSVTGMRGWLRKQGEGKLKGWKRRFFKQYNNRLFYFASENDQLDNALGYVDVSQITNVFVISDCNFDVHTPGRIYHFELNKGEDKTEMQKWIDGFSQFLIKNEKDNEELHQNGEKEGLVPMKGWLRKFGEGTLRGWKRRFFRQEGKTLFYFVNERDRDSIGLIELEQVTRIETQTETLFTVVTMNQGNLNQKLPKRSNEVQRFQLQAADKVEMFGWIDELKSWLRFYRVEFQVMEVPYTPTAVQALHSIQSFITKDHQMVDLPKDSELVDLPKEQELVYLEKTKEEEEEKEEPEEVEEEILVPSRKKSEAVKPLPAKDPLNDLLPFFGCVGSIAAIVFFLPLRYTISIFFGFFLCLSLLAFGIYFFLIQGEEPEKELFNLDLSRWNRHLPSAQKEPLPSSSSTEEQTSSNETEEISVRRDSIVEQTPKETEEMYLFIVNLLVGRIYREHAQSEGFKEAYRQRLNIKLKEIKKPAFIGSLEISHLDLGNNSFEIVNGVTLKKPQQEGELRAAFYVRYQGDAPANVTLNASVCLNFPQVKFASVPVSLTVTMEQLSGPMLFVMPPGEDPACTLAFTSEPTSKWAVTSKIGSKGKISGIPKVSQFLVNKLHQFMKRDMVDPNGVCFHIPIKNQRQLKVRLLRKIREDQVDVGSTTAPAAPVASTSPSVDPVPLEKDNSSKSQRDHGLQLPAKQKTDIGKKSDPIPVPLAQRRRMSSDEESQSSLSPTFFPPLSSFISPPDSSPAWLRNSFPPASVPHDSNPLEAINRLIPSPDNLSEAQDPLETESVDSLPSQSDSLGFEEGLEEHKYRIRAYSG